MLLSLTKPHGTIAPLAWYYRIGRGCKKLHPPLLPLMLLSLARAHGTTAPKERYYRVGRGCKKLHPLLLLQPQQRLPGAMVLQLQRSGTTVGACGTTVPGPGTTARACGTTAPRSSTTTCPSSAITTFCIYKKRRSAPKCQRKGGAKEKMCM